MKQFPIFLLSIASFLSACSQQATPILSKDSTYVTITVEGKKMTIPLVNKWERGMLFATDKPFVQGNTTYLYREYSYYQCDTCTNYQLDSSSYYIRSKLRKDYLQHLHHYIYWMQGAKGTEEYFTEAYNYLRKKSPTLQHNQLGDIPRMWYPVVKYRGKYYISIDNLTAVELTDSIVVYHDMEIALSALLQFTKIGKDSYRWLEHPEYFEGIDTVTLRPVKHVKGLYVMSTVRKELGITVHQLVTPESDIHHFDFIDWHSSDHIPDGLTYDTVNTVLPFLSY